MKFLTRLPASLPRPLSQLITRKEAVGAGGGQDMTVPSCDDQRLIQGFAVGSKISKDWQGRQHTVERVDRENIVMVRGIQRWWRTWTIVAEIADAIIIEDLLSEGASGNTGVLGQAGGFGRVAQLYPDKTLAELRLLGDDALRYMDAACAE